MKPVNYEIRKLGPIKYLEGEFPNAGVVYISGDNGQGKSTFIRMFNDLLTGGSNDGKLQRGARSGDAVITFQAANGDEYIAKFDFDPTSRDRFSIVTPDGKIVKSIGDVKDLFKYNAFTVEEFINLGTTAEGRRKQADILLKMLPKADFDRYVKCNVDEAAAVEERKFQGKKLKEAEGAMAKAKLGQDDLEEAKLYDTLAAEEQQILEEMGAFNSDDIHNAQQQLFDAQTQLRIKHDDLTRKLETHADVTTEIEELEAKLAKLKEKKATIEAEGKILRSAVKTMETIVAEKQRIVDDKSADKKAYDLLSQKLESVRRSMGEVLEIKLRIDTYEKMEEEVFDLRKVHEQYDKRVKDLRNAKKEIIAKANLPIKDIEIVDDELHVRKGDELFKFNEEEMCTSELLSKGIEIALAANPHTKMLFLFNSNLLNQEKLDALDALAKHEDYLFILERMDDGQPIHLVAHENKS